MAEVIGAAVLLILGWSMYGPGGVLLAVLALAVAWVVSRLFWPYPAVSALRWHRPQCWQQREAPRRLQALQGHPAGPPVRCWPRPPGEAERPRPPQVSTRWPRSSGRGHFY